jgi:uncharacterized surface protein with fasciclin (FAS1) repeats
MASALALVLMVSAGALAQAQTSDRGWGWGGSSYRDSGCVTVCHKPGTPAEKDLCLPMPAVRAHLRHGDVQGSCEGEYGETILDRLLRTDGAQALVASVLVVDDALGSEIADTLGDPEADLVLFAPANAAFAELLTLEAGDLDGLSIETISGLIPVFLGQLGLAPEDVRDILLKHVAANPVAPEDASEDALLDLGSITVIDESVFPVSIGPGGVAINYEAGLTKVDVFTDNGVIHFLDAVIVGATEPPDEAEVCTLELCGNDEALLQQCEDFLDSCMMSENPDECAPAASLICRGTP